jgi:hypothetical protein
MAFFESGNISADAGVILRIKRAEFIDSYFSEKTGFNAEPGQCAYSIGARTAGNHNFPGCGFAQYPVDHGDVREFHSAFFTFDIIPQKIIIHVN